MAYGKGLLVGFSITMRHFVDSFLRDFQAGKGFKRRGGGTTFLDFWKRPALGDEPIIRQDAATEGLFTVEYPDERLPLFERSRVLPVLIYDEEDGNIRCTSCHICAKVCPPQCIWMSQAKGPNGKVVPLPAEFFIDMDVCMNCGLCAEYCPFDAIKMDQNFEQSNYERHQTHIFSLEDLLVWSEYYAKSHPDAWNSEDEVSERAKQAKKKTQRVEKALGRPPA